MTTRERISRHTRNKRCTAIAVGAIALVQASAWAEKRTVTVTVDKEVTYISRKYLCATPAGVVSPPIEVLGGGAWTVSPPGGTRTFDVACPGGTRVIGFASALHWTNTTCLSTIGKAKGDAAPLGSVTSSLDCVKDQSGSVTSLAGGVCDIYGCSSEIVCDIPQDLEGCDCPPESVLTEGVHYFNEGSELDGCGDPGGECGGGTLGGPAVSEWGLVLLTLLGMVFGTVLLQRRRQLVGGIHDGGP